MLFFISLYSASRHDDCVNIWSHKVNKMEEKACTVHRLEEFEHRNAINKETIIDQIQIKRGNYGVDGED